jgi:outer membrane protein assembly factor BamB
LTRRPGRLCSSPIVDGSRVILTCGEPGNEMLLALQMLVTNNRVRPMPAYKRRDSQANYANTLALWDGTVFGYGGGGLECTDAASGKTLWRDKGSWKNDLQLIVADGLLFVQTGDELVLLEADKSACKELARFRPPTQLSLQQPSLANGRLYLRGETEVLCFQVSADPAAKRSFVLRTF